MREEGIKHWIVCNWNRIQIFFLFLMRKNAMKLLYFQPASASWPYHTLSVMADSHEMLRNRQPNGIIRWVKKNHLTIRIKQSQMHTHKNGNSMIAGSSSRSLRVLYSASLDLQRLLFISRAHTFAQPVAHCHHRQWLCVGNSWESHAMTMPVFGYG